MPRPASSRSVRVASGRGYRLSDRCANGRSGCRTVGTRYGRSRVEAKPAARTNACVVIIDLLTKAKRAARLGPRIARPFFAGVRRSVPRAARPRAEGRRAAQSMKRHHTDGGRCIMRTPDYHPSGRTPTAGGVVGSPRAPTPDSQFRRRRVPARRQHPAHVPERLGERLEEIQCRIFAARRREVLERRRRIGANPALKGAQGV